MNQMVNNNNNNKTNNSSNSLVFGRWPQTKKTDLGTVKNLAADLGPRNFFKSFHLDP